MSVHTGPKASTEWIARALPASRQYNRVGDTKAPRSASAPTGCALPASPYTTSASRLSLPSCSRTSRRWLKEATGPMRTLSSRGSPTTILPSALRSASMTSVTRLAGTIAFLMAVHFWPAFTVISRTTSRTNRSSSGVPAPASGPSTEELSEQTPHAPADELHGAFRQDLGLHHPPEHALGEVTGLRGRLHDRRHAGEQSRRQLLQHAPDRKVERVDVHRGALERYAHVLAHESPGLGERFHAAIDVHAAVG